MALILVVDDDPEIQQLLGYVLRREGHETIEALTGEDALKIVQRTAPDLVILDLMLPGLQGEAVMGALREQSAVPILITSAKRADVDRIAGLRLGADDYLGKPFNPHELLARVEAILRRTAPREPPDGVLSIAGGRLVLDPVTRRYALGSGETGKLTPGEAALLVALAEQPGKTLTRAQLLERVARRPDEVYDRVVDVHVANLRRKLADSAMSPWLVETVPEIGYRLVAAVDGSPLIRSEAGG